jgi:HAD superfamily hydrolase (TIGR01509 family)
MPNPEPPSPLPRPEGLIFDLDGTLVDTVRARIDGWLEALRASGLEVGDGQVAPMIGMDGKRLARLVAEANGRTPTDDELEAWDRAAGEAFDRRNRAPRPLPGFAEVLAAIDELGLRWCIATSSRREQVTASVAALALPDEPVIVDGSHVEHAKPAPDLLLLAAERLGLPPARCWAVGDSTWDMRATVAAGETAIGVLAGSAVSERDLLDAGAARVMPTLGELAVALRGASLLRRP